MFAANNRALSLIIPSARGETPPHTASPGTAPLLAVVRNLDHALQALDDYTCDVESLYFRKGQEEERYRLKFHYRRPNLFRLDLSLPYPGISIFYTAGEDTLVAGPSRLLTGLRFRYSLDNTLFKTPSGQRINQVTLPFFRDFLLKNIQKVHQDDPAYRETEGEVSFRLNALDFIRDRVQERYLIVMSRKSWLPLRLERHEPGGTPLEITHFKNYRINTGLDEKLFTP